MTGRARSVLLLAAATALTIAFSHGKARAIPIEGEIVFAGAVAPMANGQSASLGTATALDFLDPISVIRATLDFVPALGSTATFTDFTFNPAATPVADPLWVVNVAGGDSFRFRLDTVTIAFQNDLFLSLQGDGTLFATGFDATPGRWSLTSTGGPTQFGFASHTVPEPGTMLLLGSGVLGLAALSRRRIV